MVAKFDETGFLPTLGITFDLGVARLHDVHRHALREEAGRDVPPLAQVVLCTRAQKASDFVYQAAFPVALTGRCHLPEQLEVLTHSRLRLTNTITCMGAISLCTSLPGHCKGDNRSTSASLMAAAV